MREQELHACVVPVCSGEHEGVAAAAVAFCDAACVWGGGEEGVDDVGVAEGGGEHEGGLVEGVEGDAGGFVAEGEEEQGYGEGGEGGGEVEGGVREAGGGGGEVGVLEEVGVGCEDALDEGEGVGVDCPAEAEGRVDPGGSVRGGCEGGL